MKRNLLPNIVTLLLAFFFLIPESAWALQSHSAPEGNYVHQIAHVLFMGSLLYLFWHTRKTKDLQGRGWKYLQLFCVLFAGWNIVAFIGHEVFGQLAETDFLDKNSWNERLAAPITPTKVIYFFTKMDHLLYVPALLALVISLRTFYLDALREEKK